MSYYTKVVYYLDLWPRRRTITAIHTHTHTRISYDIVYTHRYVRVRIGDWGHQKTKRQQITKILYASVLGRRMMFYDRRDVHAVCAGTGLCPSSHGRMICVPTGNGHGRRTLCNNTARTPLTMIVVKRFVFHKTDL